MKRTFLMTVFWILLAPLGLAQDSANPKSSLDSVASEVTTSTLAKPNEKTSWLIMAPEIAREMKKDLDAIIRLHGPDHPRVDVMEKAIDHFKELSGQLLFMDVSDQSLTQLMSKLEKGPNVHRAERDWLIKKNNTEYDKQILELDIVIAWATVRERHEERDSALQAEAKESFPEVVPPNSGARKVPIQELQQQLAKRRQDYTDAESQTRKLARQLKHSPDATKKAELRKAVQNAFSARQRLLLAELSEMQTRLLQSQRSIENREEIADQIVDRRVEDLLNPQLDWDETAAAGESLSQSVTSSRSTEANVSGQKNTASSEIPAGMRVVSINADDVPLTIRDMIQPGDRVDVLVTGRFPGGESATSTLLEFIEVFAVDNFTDQINQPKAKLRHISLLVTSEMVDAILIAKNRGRLSLVLRSPTDDEAPAINASVIVALQRLPAKNVDMLTRLQGAWELKIRSTDPLPADVRLGVEIDHDLMRSWFTHNGKRHEDQTVQLKLGEDGPPQQITLVLDPNNQDQRLECFGIVEIREDVVRICYGSSSDSQRPEVFAVGKGATIWELRRPPVGANVALLDRLQGAWDVQQMVEADGDEQPTVMVKAVVQGNRIRFQNVDGSNPASFDLHVGLAGQPQQVDLHPILGPNDVAQIRAGNAEAAELGGPLQSETPVFPGIIEIDQARIRICLTLTPADATQRPTQFVVGPTSAIWEFRRTPPVDSKAAF
jgi:uncharacterized protein (TIGR03067 family)